MRFSSAILLGLALTASACGSSSSPSSPSPSSPATPGDLVTVNIQSFSYQPNPVTVKVGTQINWLNKDSVDHTATADDGRFDNFVNAMSAHGAPVTFSTAGTFTYHCTIHPNMHGTIVVQ